MPLCESHVFVTYKYKSNLNENLKILRQINKLCKRLEVTKNQNCQRLIFLENLFVILVRHPLKYMQCKQKNNKEQFQKENVFYFLNEQGVGEFGKTWTLVCLSSQDMLKLLVRNWIVSQLCEKFTQEAQKVGFRF